MKIEAPYEAIQEEVKDIIASVQQEKTTQWIEQQLDQYIQHLNKLSQTQETIEALEEGKDSELYIKAVDELMDATYRYYDFISGLPVKMRRLFHLLIEFSGSHEVMDTIHTITGSEITFDPTPLVSIRAIRPKKYIMQNDAITNSLAKLKENNEIKVGKYANQPIRTSVTLDMPDHMKIEGGASLSTYDKSIINGVTSLLESGNTVFSIPMLYHAITGRQNPTIDDALAEEISSKLEKMRRMMIAIDLTEEVMAHTITDENNTPLKIENLIIDGYLLPLSKMSGMINGKKTEVYQILQKPPLYSYSKLKKQLSTVPISLLGAPINNNSTTIPLKTYLLQRIEMMKNQNNSIRSNTILYSSIYEELGASDTNKTKKMRLRTYTTTILQYFISQKYIASFCEIKKGRSIFGVTITLPDSIQNRK